jgi:hypothetical protein
LTIICSSSFFRREPGDIDNSLLIDKNHSNNNRVVNDDCVQLKSGLRHTVHFEMVPESLWLFLRKYYRCIGPAICRKVTYRKKLNKPELDLYPVSFDFHSKINSFLLIFSFKFLIKIHRNQSLSPQQLQNTATNTPTTTTNNTNSHSMYFVYPLFNFVSASMFGKNSSDCFFFGYEDDL